MSMRVVFSKQLLDYRTANHLTQYQMAEMCGLSVRRYQELEQGHSLPLLSTAVRMAAVFDLSLDSLKRVHLPLHKACGRVQASPACSAGPAFLQRLHPGIYLLSARKASRPGRRFPSSACRMCCMPAHHLYARCVYMKYKQTPFISPLAGGLPG